MTKKYFYDEAEVLAVPEPEWTKTWHPVGHHRVINTLDKVLDDSGIGVKNKHYTLTKDGNNCFSSWVLDVDRDGRNWMVGFRNSINKSFALGFTGGVNIMVCSNMMFNGEFIEFQKHTNEMDDELIIKMANGAFNQIQEKSKMLEQWHEKLSEFPFRSLRNFKALTFDAMQKGIIAPQKFNNFCDAYKEEMEVDNSRSLKTFHGSVTRILRGNSLFNQSDKNKLLNNFCDEYMMAKAA